MWSCPWVFFLTTTSKLSGNPHTVPFKHTQKAASFCHFHCYILIQVNILFHLEYCNSLPIRFPASSFASIIYPQYSCQSGLSKMKIKSQRFSISSTLKSQTPLMAHKAPCGCLRVLPWPHSLNTLPLAYSVPEKWPPSCFSKIPVMFPPQGLWARS